MSESENKNVNGKQETTLENGKRRKVWRAGFTDRRITPHWSMLTTALILFAFLLYQVEEYLTPLTLTIAMLIILYPSRRMRAIKPLIVLTILIAIISIWVRLHSLITPFIVAFFIAYAIDPVVEYLVNRKIPRLLVVFMLTGVIIGAMIGIGIMIVPRLIDEVSDLAFRVPRWLDEAWNWGESSFVPWLSTFNLPVDETITELQTKLPIILNRVMSTFTDWSSSALSTTMNVISGIANVILIPILAVYFINAFRNIKDKSFAAVPVEHRPITAKILGRLNTVLSAYIRGQLLVCTFLAVFIGSGLWLIADLPYALLLGISAGFANLIPYVGTYSVGLLTILIAGTQPDPIFTIIKAMAVFLVAQGLEGNILTPRVVGDKVGLHPLIVIFVVLLFASLFGLIGMLIAIPVTASIKEMIILYLEYRKTRSKDKTDSQHAEQAEE